MSSGGGGLECGLFLDGTRCTSCLRRIERALQDLPGVIEARVNYTAHRAQLRYDPAALEPSALVRCVEALGYGATLFDLATLGRSAAALRGAREALTRVLVAAFLAGNVMLIAIALYLGEGAGLDPETRRALRWIAAGLSVPAIGWCALPFWRGAFSGLRRREITMDVPVVLGMSVAFAVHVAGTWAERDQLYVDSAALIVFLILLGRTLERAARARAASAVDRLSALAPRRALRRTPSGALEDVEATQLQPGDRVVVSAGEWIPADGRIELGSSEVDESLLTGESRPVLRAVGDAVIGASRCCLGEIELRVTAAAGAGTLARLAALLERAQADRPRVQQLADRVAAVFAPAVLLAATGAALFSIAQGAAPLDVALRAAAVLIAACPCALGLATPSAITAAIGRAAQWGILIKRGDALERWAEVDCVLLDKTGTLTSGRLAVDAIRPAAGRSEAAVLDLALRAEGASRHPIAEALRAAAARPEGASADSEPVERRTIPGRGVQALCDGERWLVGSRRMLEEAGVELEAKLEEAAAELAPRGLTLVWVARGPRAEGLIALSDPLRPDARRALERLRDGAVEVALVSGDEPGAVGRAGERAGLRESALHARVDPAGKLERVRISRHRWRRVLFAGDGVNDAPALAAADVGVAMGEGADVALHAADVVIRSPRLSALADGQRLARACVARIRENLGLAIGYNALAVPLAASGWLDPLSAAVAMSLSSLVVTANAARLLRWKPRP